MEPNQQQAPQQEAETTYYQPTAAQQTPTEQPETVGDGLARLPEVEPVQWKAIEYIQHAKTPLWYVGFGVITIGLMVLAIFIMQTWTFALLIPVMAGALLVYSHRPPRELSYALSEQGIHINDQLHPLSEFKSFGVIQNDTLNSLVLVPTKRFRPGLTVYFPAEVGEQIVDLLGGYMPMEQVRYDVFDRIVHKLQM